MCSHSESINEIAKALSEFQGKVKNPVRNKTVKVRTVKGSYQFEFATFDSILDKCRPLLAEHGLAVIQTSKYKPHGPDDTPTPVVAVTTMLIHSSGEWFRGELALPAVEAVFVQGQPPKEVNITNPQKIGSLISYARRYSLVGLLGISSEEDDDANIAEGNQVTTQQAKPAAHATIAPSATASQDVKYVPAAEIETFRANLRKTFPSNDQMKRAGEIITKHGVNLRDRETPVTTNTYEKIRADLQLYHESLKKKAELEAA